MSIHQRRRQKLQPGRLRRDNRRLRLVQRLVRLLRLHLLVRRVVVALQRRQLRQRHRRLRAVQATCSRRLQLHRRGEVEVLHVLARATAVAVAVEPVCWEKTTEAANR